MLPEQDEIALRMIFRDQSVFSLEMVKRIGSAVSLERQETGVGFYSTIKLNPPLSQIPDVKMWEFNFSHPEFPHGGSYMCSVLDDATVELEAVTFGGEKWPSPKMSNLFIET